MISTYVSIHESVIDGSYAYGFYEKKRHERKRTTPTNSPDVNAVGDVLNQVADDLVFDVVQHPYAQQYSVKQKNNNNKAINRIRTDTEIGSNNDPK